MADYIDREQAVDALNDCIKESDMPFEWGQGVASAIYVIRHLPSAEIPTFDEWCTDCKEYDSEKHSCPRFNRVIAEAVKDVRENVRGEWIDLWMSSKNVPTETCGVCGEWSYGMKKNFCPNCGADMRGTDDVSNE